MNAKVSSASATTKAGDRRGSRRGRVMGKLPGDEHGARDAAGDGAVAGQGFGGQYAAETEVRRLFLKAHVSGSRRVVKKNHGRVDETREDEAPSDVHCACIFFPAGNFARLRLLHEHAAFAM